MFSVSTLAVIAAAVSHAHAAAPGFIAANDPLMQYIGRFASGPNSAMMFVRPLSPLHPTQPRCPTARRPLRPAGHRAAEPREYRTQLTLTRGALCVPACALPAVGHAGVRDPCARHAARSSARHRRHVPAAQPTPAQPAGQLEKLGVPGQRVRGLDRRRAPRPRCVLTVDG